MTRQTHTLAAIALTAFFAASATAYGQQAAEPPDHSSHHPEAATPGAAATPAAPGMMDSMKMMESMKKSNARLDELVTKMNAAKGAAKTDAIAELLTALVAKEHSCETMMAEKMKAK